MCICVFSLAPFFLFLAATAAAVIIVVCVIGRASEREATIQEMPMTDSDVFSPILDTKDLHTLK
jgi:hypothetical protein